MSTSMRIRKEFAAAFAFVLAAAAFAGLNSKESKFNPGQYTEVVPHGDKGLHFFTFFALTLAFYWSFETSRRRAIHLTLICITGILAVGSEFLQAALPNDREFDLFDIVANLVGSGAALGLCAWYHRRMLERRRANKYGALSGDEETGQGHDNNDIELGTNMGPQETGVTREPTIDEELDNWDENEADDWDDEEATANGGTNAGGESKKAPLDDVAKSKRDD